MTLGQKLRLLRDEQNKTQLDMCKNLNIEQSTLANYENDKRIPKIDILIELAHTFNVSTDYLLGISDTKKLPELFHPGINDETQELLDYYHQLSRRNQRLVFGKIVELLDEQDKQSVVDKNNPASPSKKELA